MLARALNLIYVDTGSMYRAVALGVINASISPTDAEAVTRLAESLEIDLAGDPDSLNVFLNGKDVTALIRTEEVTLMSSIVSAIPGVRRAMVSLQRQIGLRGAVLNGRDIGTVVFPDANFKFFLTASATERANRRYKEDVSKNSQVSLAATLADMTERDLRDSTRADSPLKIASDAIVVDSSGMTIVEVFELMMATITNNAR
jgi:cytidylate kinase